MSLWLRASLVAVEPQRRQFLLSAVPAETSISRVTVRLAYTPPLLSSCSCGSCCRAGGSCCRHSLATIIAILLSIKFTTRESSRRYFIREVNEHAMPSTAVNTTEILFSYTMPSTWISGGASSRSARGCSGACGCGSLAGCEIPLILFIASLFDQIRTTLKSIVATRSHRYPSTFYAGVAAAINNRSRSTSINLHLVDNLIAIQSCGACGCRAGRGCGCGSCRCGPVAAPIHTQLFGFERSGAEHCTAFWVLGAVTLGCAVRIFWVRHQAVPA